MTSQPRADARDDDRAAPADSAGPRGPAAQDGRPEAPIDDATRKIRGAAAASGPQAGDGSAADDPMRTQYERDQSSDATAQQPREVMRQAARDLEAGQVDTDLHGTPGQGAERRHELLEQEKARTGGTGGTGDRSEP